MKTYNQVVNQAVLIGAHAYFGGSSYWAGAHSFVGAVVFIYGVSRDQFFNDVEKRWNEVMTICADMTSDNTIAYIKNIVN